MPKLQFTQTVGLIRNFVQREAKMIIKNESVAHFRESFRNEGFTDAVLEPWPDISEQRKEKKRRRNGSLPGILTDTGELHNSIRGEIQGRNVIVSSDLPYAKRHNEGLAGMPQRQFMGPSQALERTIEKELDKGIGRLLKGFK